MKHSKIDMARVIVQAALGLPELPPANHKRVKRLAWNFRPRLEYLYERAVHVLLTPGTPEAVRKRAADYLLAKR